MRERSAIVVSTSTGASGQVNGASMRVGEIADLLQHCGYAVHRATAAQVAATSARHDLGVAVSYACAGVIRRLRDCSERTWLDAVDSWLAVNGSGLRSGRPAYGFRTARDAGRLLRMPPPDLLTYISRADLAADRSTVRGSLRLVLPGQVPGLTASPGTGRRLVLAGDWSYPPNADGLRLFWNRVLPTLEPHLARLGAAVDVYGSKVPDLRSPALRHVGYAEDARELYREGDVHVALVRFGGGVKRKVLQPLLSGLPVVTTPAGARGLRVHPLLDVHERPSELAAAILRRLTGPVKARPANSEELIDADDTAFITSWLRT
jgi:hypothetical protein